MNKLIPILFAPFLACSVDSPSLSGAESFPANSQYVEQSDVPNTLLIVVGEVASGSVTCGQVNDGGTASGQYVLLGVRGADGGASIGSYPLVDAQEPLSTGHGALILATVDADGGTIFTSAASSGQVDLSEVGTSVTGTFTAELYAVDPNGDRTNDAGLGELAGSFNAPNCASDAGH